MDSPHPDLTGVLTTAVADVAGTLVLSEVDTAVVVRVVRAAHASAQIYVAHADAAVLLACHRALATGDSRRPVVFVHGTPHAFARDVQARAAVLVTAGGDELLAFWQVLGAGALVITTAPLAEERRWTASGCLESAGGTSRYGAYRVGRRLRAEAALAPAVLFEQVALATGATLERTPGERTDALARDIAPLAQWWREHSPGWSTGFGEWPYRDDPVPLPETQPNGERWPLISIVTPSFNQGDYIEETLLSVAGQGYPRLEHIVMDGGSTDGTRAVLDRYRHQLHTAVSEKDRGQSHAINKGMALASGDILTWLNSDDLLAPGALASVAMGFHTSGADLVAGIATLRAGGVTTGHHLTSCDSGPLPLDDLLDLDGCWYAGKFFYQPEVLFSRAIWERAGAAVREDLYYSMDYDLWVRMAQAGGRLHVIGRPVAWFRQHDLQKTHDGAFRSELDAYVRRFQDERQLERRPSTVHANPRRHLRVALVNDHGFHYGAGIAHQRLAELLVRGGHEVTPFQLRREADGAGATPLTAAEVLRSVRTVAPDLVMTGNLHSAASDASVLALLVDTYPTLSVLHDFWLLTGRCAYPGDCTQYLTGCEASCPTADEYPRLARERIADAWIGKRALLSADNRLVLLGNSRWTTAFANDALQRPDMRPVQRLETFRLGFPVERLGPRDRASSRMRLGLPHDRFIVLLPGDLYDRRKNIRAALEALERLAWTDLTVVSLGTVEPGETFPFADLRRFGHIDDAEVMADLFAAADVCLVPSLQETFGQVCIESMAAGTPVIGVRGSGIDDAIVDGVTGLLVRDAAAMTDALERLHNDPSLAPRLGQWGRLHAENEWSLEAAYYHLFGTWRRLGLLTSLGLPEKIDFHAEPPALPVCRPLAPEGEPRWSPLLMGPEEGPYQQWALPRFRWAYGPAAELLIQSAHRGTHTLVLRYRNLHAGQQVRLRLAGVELGTFALATTGIVTDRLLCLPVELEADESVLRMEFSRWSEPPEVDRPLAVAITELRLLADRLASASAQTASA